MVLALACGLPLCPFASVTGVPCPGCGLLRATLALIGGDVPSALRYHPLVLAALPAGLLAAAHVLTSWPRGRLGRRGLEITTTFVVTSLLGVWVARFFGEFGGPVVVRTLWSLR